VYAVIRTGGGQARVAEGERLDVDRLGADEGAELSFTPVLVVDGDTVLSTPAELAGASVAARVVGSSRGPKIRGFTYKSKSRNRRRWGHRQRYTTIEVTGISRSGPGASAPAEEGS
jgi:large subunit ribosomal protein L21